LLERVEPADVLNVFTGVPAYPVQSPWVRLTGFADSTSSMRARRAEDDAAFADSPHRRHNLELLDNELSPHPRPPADRRAISDKIASWADGIGAGSIAAPAGAGRRGGRLRRRLPSVRPPIPVHPDHLIVRDAAVCAHGQLGAIGLWLYEELPYGLDVRADRAMRALRLRGLRFQALSVPIEIETKAKRIAAYESQLPHLVPGGLRLDDPDLLPRMERYWYLPPKHLGLAARP
jgi:hypothetical protein